MLGGLPAELLRGRLIVDVLSVKQYAKKVLLDGLPAEADILCTHPMFGPESGKNSWHGLPLVFEQVRVVIIGLPPSSSDCPPHHRIAHPHHLIAFLII